MTPNSAVLPKIDCASTAHGPKPKGNSCAPLLVMLCYKALPSISVSCWGRVRGHTCESLLYANSPMKTQLHCARYSGRRISAQQPVTPAVSLCGVHSCDRVMQVVHTHRCADACSGAPASVRTVKPSGPALGICNGKSRQAVIHAATQQRNSESSDLHLLKSFLPGMHVESSIHLLFQRVVGPTRTI